MTKEIKIPQITEGADAVTVADIYVKKGDTVKQGQEVIAVDSDKASVDVPNEEGDGTVQEIKISKGDEVKVGDVIITLEMAEEGSSSDDAGSGKKEASAEESSAEEKEAPAKASASKEEQKENSSPESRLQPADSGSDQAPAAPLAKKFARELGIDIAELQSGSKGERVTRDAVMNYARQIIEQYKRGGASTPAAAPARGGGVEPIELPDFSQWGETEREPLSGIRTAVAKNTTKSWQNIPHVTQHDQADMTELLDFKKALAKKDTKLSVTAILTKIAVEALKQFPKFNTSLDLHNRELIYKKYINIGMAVDTDDGLMMPVIHNADKMGVEGINDRIKELAGKARDRKLQPDEMKGGNFGVSNLGGIGGTSFTPVIFPPQVAILGVSATQNQAVYNGEEFEPRPMLPLSLSYDHRVIDGAEAARFLRWMCDVIEQPFNLIG